MRCHFCARDAETEHVSGTDYLFEFARSEPERHCARCDVAVCGRHSYFQCAETSEYVTRVYYLCLQCHVKLAYESYAQSNRCRRALLGVPLLGTVLAWCGLREMASTEVDRAVIEDVVRTPQS